jgi:hypothetical protein
MIKLAGPLSLPAPILLVIMPIIAFAGLPSPADLIGWSGTILSLATAFTGGFVMIYQRIQRARRDDLVEWMKLKQGSLQTSLEKARQELKNTQDELTLSVAKVETLGRQNDEQLKQIIKLTRQITRLGVLIGRLPGRIGLTPKSNASDEHPEQAVETLGQTVDCLEGLVDQLRETTRVLGRLAQLKLDRSPSRPPEDTQVETGDVSKDLASPSEV